MEGFEEFQSVRQLKAARQKLLDKRDAERQADDIKMIREWIKKINERALDLNCKEALTIQRASKRVYELFMAATHYDRDVFQLRSGTNGYELIVQPFWLGDQEQ